MILFNEGVSCYDGRKKVGLYYLISSSEEVQNSTFILSIRYKFHPISQELRQIRKKGFNLSRSEGSRGDKNLVSLQCPWDSGGKGRPARFRNTEKKCLLTSLALRKSIPV